MAKSTTTARPYAKAAFKFALEHKQLNEWHNLLQIASVIVLDSDVKKLLTNPNISTEQILGLIFSILEKELDQNKKNFLNLLAIYQHLIILPEITKLYVAFRAAYEKVIDAHVTSAFELTDKQKDAISEALKKRLQHQVRLYCVVDEKILGGAIIHIDDLVIDGSGYGKLARLYEYIRGNVVCN